MFLQHMITTAFRSWWFDPLIASLSFITSIMIYSHYELVEGKSCYNNFSQLLFSKGIDKTDTRNSLSMSLITYWIGILIWVQLVPPPSSPIESVVGDDVYMHMPMSWNSTIHVHTTTIPTTNNSIPDGIPNSLSTLSYLVTEVITGIFLYDTIFFFIHYAMHEFKIFAKLTNHREHHKAIKNLEARHVLRHSLIDGILQVLVNIAVQRHTPWGNVKSRLARILHNVIVTAMLTESHTASSYPNLFRWWCVGIRNHRNHHLGTAEGGRRSNDEGEVEFNSYYYPHRHYQQFFGHWDYLRELYSPPQILKKSKLV